MASFFTAIDVQLRHLNMPEHFEVRRMADYLIDHGLVGQRLVDHGFMNQGERILKTPAVDWHQLRGQRLNHISVKAKTTGFEFDTVTVILHYPRFTGFLIWKAFHITTVCTPYFHCRFQHNSPNIVAFLGI